VKSYTNAPKCGDIKEGTSNKIRWKCKDLRFLDEIEEKFKNLQNTTSTFYNLMDIKNGI
jgi:hypothetical protein